MKINVLGISTAKQELASFFLEVFFNLCKKYDVDKEWIFTFFSEIKKYKWIVIPQWILDEINAQVIRDPELLDAKVKSDVSMAIDELKLPPSSVSLPIFTEVKQGSTALGGKMRLKAPWVKE